MNDPIAEQLKIFTILVNDHDGPEAIKEKFKMCMNSSNPFQLLGDLDRELEFTDWTTRDWGSDAS